MSRPERGPGWRRPLLFGAVLSALALAAFASPRFREFWEPDRREEVARLAKAPVRRASFAVTASASGQTESSNQTRLRCEVESINYRSRGSTFTSGSTTILSLVPDGAMVKEGDVLCKLDASAYIEIVRTQSIKVEEERAEVVQAELELDVAELAVREFLEGIYARDIQEMDGKIKLAESDVERWEDRLKWSERMVDKGYVSLANLANERQSTMKARQQLFQAKLARDNYVTYTRERTLTQLEGRVEQARVKLANERRGLEMNEERLAHYQSMIEKATIRAPHDGMVVYASNSSSNRGNDRDRIEVGFDVRQRQDLFFLPDLSQMRVVAMIHETVVEKVRTGMPAKITVEGMPGRVLEGHVELVTRLPLIDRNAQDVKNYVGQVKIDTVPEGIKPGMSAQVEILTAQKQDVLTVPPSAVTIDRGREVCYVAREEGLERRPVSLGESSREMLEIVDGLAEGELVVVNPLQYDDLATLVIEPEPVAETATAVAAAH